MSSPRTHRRIAPRFRRVDRFSRFCGFVSALLLVVPTGQCDEKSDSAVSFDRVAAVLSSKCVSCHKPDNRKGNLDLTTRATAMQGGDGGAALVASKPLESPLLIRSQSMDGQPPEMPEKGDPLTETEVDMIRQWIDEGATWPEDRVLREPSKADSSFWSFQPLMAAKPPEGASDGGRWNDHPIDRFLLVRMREVGLKPNEPAAPEALLRRVYFDLIGLPPSPEEIIAFKEELRLEAEGRRRPGATYERWVDRLLASPRYGERWGRHWLDVIRFGESRGYERNEIITNLWPFRDYVIASWNADKPFDRLVLEHLAGDVIGMEQPDVEIGSAFLVAGPYDDVGNQDPVAAAQIRSDQMDEMIRATGEAFLGLTIGCARCHDHKFDPLTTKDYYGWYATFAGTTHGPREVATRAARESRAMQLKPLEAQRSEITAAIDAQQRALQERIAAKDPEIRAKWIRPKASRYLTEETFAAHEARHIRLVYEGTDSANPSAAHGRIDEFEVWSAADPQKNVALASHGSTASGASRNAKDFGDAYSAALTIDGAFGERWIAQGNELRVTFPGPETIERVTFSSDRRRELPEDHDLTVFIGDYRLESSMDGEHWRTLATSDDRLPISAGREQARLKRQILSEEDLAKTGELQRQLQEVNAAIARVPGLPIWWVGNHAPAPGPFHVFLGGNPQRRGDEVLPHSPTVLDTLPIAYQAESAVEEGERRKRLAAWITAEQNPLTARVLVNRMWHYHFGAGLVNTPSDFGYMGERPSHPELLDWLSRRLIENQWHIKPLHRLILLSQAYQQSAAWNESHARIDADSRLLWRFPPRRLSGEELRDSMLAAAGQLNLTMGGPGFRLYEYQQDNVATYVPLDAPGRETYRRAVYHHNARAARVDVMTDFDCPDPAFAEPKRASTITPLQALTMMNHRFAWDVARQFAERLKVEDVKVVTAAGAADDERSQRIDLAFSIAFGRTASIEEREAASALVSAHGWHAFCRAILNSNEFVYLE